MMWTIADPTQAIELDPNPPTLETQQEQLVARIAALEKSVADATAEPCQPTESSRNGNRGSRRDG